MDLVLSPDGFPPTVWGPHLWKVMHIVSMNYPLVPTKLQERGYFQFFQSLMCVLPCRSCRDEFKKLVRSGTLKLTPSLFHQFPRDPPGTARLRVVLYVIALHSAVNARLGKVQYFKGDSQKTRQFWIDKYARLRKKNG